MAKPKQVSTRVSKTTAKTLSEIAKDSKIKVTIPILLDRAVAISKDQLVKELCS